MDIENLNLIISTLNELGTNSKEAFMWWLAVTYGATYLFGFIWSCIALYIIKLGYRLINNLTDSSKLMKAAGVTGYFTPSELKKACETLRKHYKDTRI